MRIRVGSARYRLALFGLLPSAALVLAACGSSSGGKTSAGSTVSSGHSPSSSQAQSSSGITIKAATVPGLGTVLVDGTGRTLYMLTSEQGGKLTCTDDNGCTKVWPDTELPKGVGAATAGPGIQPSLLGTVKDAGGSLYVTYGGWPLYTFARDSGPGQSQGEGITSFGGTWYVLNTSGQPVKSAAHDSGASTSSTSAAYGY